jgi:hypothetical protein
MTDLEKMAAGELYWGFNPVFVPALERGQDYCHRYNLLPPSEKAARNNLLKEFFKKLGNQVIVNPPMHIDLGNLEVGDHTIINFNFVALDEALVSIGEHCFIGPNCSIYTVTHSLCYQDRDLGLMTAFLLALKIIAGYAVTSRCCLVLLSARDRLLEPEALSPKTFRRVYWPMGTPVELSDPSQKMIASFWKE